MNQPDAAQLDLLFSLLAPFDCLVLRQAGSNSVLLTLDDSAGDRSRAGAASRALSRAEAERRTRRLTRRVEARLTRPRSRCDNSVLPCGDRAQGRR